MCSLPSDCPSAGFLTGILCSYLSGVCYITHCLINFCLITLMMCYEECTLQRSSLFSFLQLSVIFCFLSPNIILSTLLPILCSSHMMKSQVWCLYKTTGKIRVWSKVSGEHAFCNPCCRNVLRTMFYLFSWFLMLAA